LEAYSPVPSLDLPTEFGGEGLPLFAADLPIPLSIPPSVVLALVWTEVGGVTPRLLAGTVGEYGLSLPLMFWYLVMGDHSLLSVEMGERAALRPLFIMFRGKFGGSQD
jgi:hypothetical protein